MLRVRDYICSGGSGDSNEDSLGVRGNIAWVIDGASPLSIERVVQAAETDAQWLSQALGEEISARALGDDLSLVDILRAAIEGVRERAESEWVSRPEIPPSAAVALIRATGHTVEYLVLADVSVVMRTTDSTVVVSDTRVDDGNTAAMEKLTGMLESGAPFVVAMSEVRPLLAERRVAGMNKPGGYWVASLDPDVVDQGLHGTVEGVESILLASDGFARAVDLFSLWPSWESFMDEGPPVKDVLRRIREVEDGDRGATQFPRWSIEDDAAGMMLEVVE